MRYIKNGEQVIAETDGGSKAILCFSKNDNEETREYILNNLMASYEIRNNTKDPPPKY